MLTFNTVFTSLVALNAFLASTGQGQVEANVLRRAGTGHSGRSHVIRGLLNVAGGDESFHRRQAGGCDVGFFACSDGTGCCPNGQTCDNLPDGTPTCCCTTGGNCPTGKLPCSSNVAVCCPTGDLCSSDGSCLPAGSGGGGGGTGGGSGGGTGGSSSKASGGTTTGGLGGGGGGGLPTVTPITTPKAPGTTITALSSSTPALGGGLGGGLGGDTTGLATTPVVTVTSTPGSSGKNGEVGLKAGTTVVMMGSVLVASALALLIL